MFRVKIVCVGRIKEPWFRDACAEYRKRLTRFAEVSVREIREENFTAEPNTREREEIVRREGEGILRELSGAVVALAVEGRKTDSEGFSRLLSAAKDGGGEVTFVIGGSYGLSPEVKARADRLLSFSDMTFPHTLMRVVLLEQVYRGFMISAGSNYHK